MRAGICLGCGGKVSENSRTQMCPGCRMAKCKHHGCKEKVVFRLANEGYCQRHLSKHRRKRMDDGGMYEGMV